jgi:branched-chain amino acid transport system permease protein
MSAISATLARPFASWTRAQRQAGAIILLTVVFAVYPLITSDDSNVDTIANAMSYATLALGLNIVVGFAGLLDLGYAAFFAIGAYYYGIFTAYQVMPEWSSYWAPLAALGLVEKINQGGPDLVHFTLSFWLALPTGAAVAAFFGVLFGAPTLKLRGDYLAIVTLGFGEIVPIMARNLDSITNGAAGLNGVASPSLFGYSFGVNAMPYYYVGMGLVALLVFSSIRLRDSRIGRAWMAIREDETAAQAMGINLRNYKLLAFAIGASFSGFTGVFFVSKLQVATPEMFSFNVSSMLIVMVVLGGMGSVWGVVLGAALLQLLQTWILPQTTGVLHSLGDMLGSSILQNIDLVQWTQMFFGIIIVIMMLFRRDGLIPATRHQPHLEMEEQHADVKRGGFVNVDAIPSWDVKPGIALEVKDVTVRFGGLVALNKVNLTVPAGGVVAVIGPNGSGKSTLFNAITGMVPAEGSIKFEGHELIGLRPDQVLDRGVARTFQNIRLFPKLTVLENVLVGEHHNLRTGPFGAILRPPKVKAEEHAALRWASDIIGLFGNRLTPRAEHSVAGLSYANRRRVEISRALASRPRILLLDEPTAGMNPNETLELAEQIAELNAKGLTILIIEHKLDVVTRLAQRVTVLDHGEVIAEGTADEVQRNEEVLTAYLGRAHRAKIEAQDAAAKEAANG